MLGKRWQAGRTPLLGRIDRQEIVVPAHERSNPILVLGSQNGASDMDDPSAPLDEAQRAFERLVLILDALLEGAGPDAPFGVGVAPPGAGARAWRRSIPSVKQASPPVASIAAAERAATLSQRFLLASPARKVIRQARPLTPM
jgi:hypothetical protein